MPVAWSLVVPVKVLARAKSRMAGLPGPRRARLALAMAADTVAAALAAGPVAAVIVVTDDAAVGAELSGLGAVVIADEPGAGLNPAMVFGAGYAGSRWPGRGVAAMAGDLPALRPAELALALEQAAAGGAAFVPDAAGTGTTLYAVGPGVAFTPAFGPGSRPGTGPPGRRNWTCRGCAGCARTWIPPVTSSWRQPSAWARGPRRRWPPGSRRRLDMHDRAGQRPGDAGDALNLGHDHLAQVVNVVGLGPDDDVVRPGDVVGLHDAGDLRNAAGDFSRLSDFSLDEDVCVNHVVLLGRMSKSHATVVTWFLARGGYERPAMWGL